MPRLLILAALAASGCVAYARADVSHYWPPVYGYAIHGTITAESSEAFLRWLADARRANAYLRIEIDSMGGDADAGLLIYRALVTSGLHMTCTAYSAGSAAAVVFSGCERRLIVREGTVVFHRPYAVLRSPVVTPELAEELYLQVRAIANVMDAISARALGLTLEQYRAKVANGASISYTADEALKVGLVHAVIDG